MNPFIRDDANEMYIKCDGEWLKILPQEITCECTGADRSVSIRIGGTVMNTISSKVTNEEDKIDESLFDKFLIGKEIK